MVEMYRRYEKGPRARQKTHLVVSSAEACSFDAGDLRRHGFYCRLRAQVSLRGRREWKFFLDARRGRRSLGFAVGGRWEGLPGHAKRRFLHLRGRQTENASKHYTARLAN